MSSPVVALSKISKTYASGRVEVRALDEVTLEIMPGELLAIMGPSGSGKTTLMEILGCLMQPTSGSYHFNGRPIETFTPDELARLRGEEIGFVFQAFNLLPRSTAIENVELPLNYRRVPRKQRNERAEMALVRVGLGARLEHLPSELSGGMRKRVAVARAIALEPAAILYDEPTTGLDPANSRRIGALITSLRDSSA